MGGHFLWYRIQAPPVGQSLHAQRRGTVLIRAHLHHLYREEHEIARRTWLVKCFWHICKKLFLMWLIHFLCWHFAIRYRKKKKKQKPNNNPKLTNDQFIFSILYFPDWCRTLNQNTDMTTGYNTTMAKKLESAKLLRLFLKINTNKNKAGEWKYQQPYQQNSK